MTEFVLVWAAFTVVFWLVGQTAVGGRQMTGLSTAHIGLPRETIKSLYRHAFELQHDEHVKAYRAWLRLPSLG